MTITNRDPKTGRIQTVFTNTECLVGDCGKRPLSRGWCGNHYKRWSKWGDPATLVGTGIRCEYRGLITEEREIARFVKYIRWGWFGCWVFTRGGLIKGGYRAFKAGQRNVYAHRWSYERFVGPIPRGLTLDHLCRNPSCVNPDHLEPVTMRENILRGNGVAAQAARRTFADCGHPFTMFNPRRCRPCYLKRMSERYQERKYEAVAL